MAGRRCALGVLLLATIGLAACSGSGGSAGSPAPTDSTVPATVAPSTTTVAPTTTTTVPVISTRDPFEPVA
jgi:ABC-type glycerol-3-phosphate transport system substrate-binding protein